MTLYPDAALRAAPPKPRRPRVFVPVALSASAALLRARGFATVAALGPVEDAAAEARRLACTHLATENGEASPLKGP